MKISMPAIDQKLRSDTLWAQAQLPRPFPRERIDIWRLRLDEPRTEASATIILSPDEATRANRFHFERDRIYFSQCRSTLRRLLASYLAMPAAEISFEYLASGKPRLIAAQNPHGLQFNVSHSANLALIAVGSCHQLGVDIEKIRADVDTTSLAERFFSLRERAGLQALPEQLGVSAFFACWTRKEAFLKATGEGLSFPLADFSVSTHPDRDPVMEEIKGNTEAGKQWFLADLSVAPGFRATVATGHSRSRVETYAWN